MERLGRRIMIIGSPGAGKSTLARALAEGTGLPLIHLDREHWLPGWVPMEKEAWRAHVAELIKRDAWIIDGNYGGTMAMRMERADTIIFLDFSRPACMWGILIRVIKHMGRTRPDMGEGCAERLDWAFFRYVWNFPENGRPAVARRLSAPGLNVIVLRTRRAARDFIKRVGRDI